MILYGGISVNGVDDLVGGVSGGSILLWVGMLFGYGEIVLNGGSGFGFVFGGFGGCIVFYIMDKIFFIGMVSSYGGCGVVCGVVGMIFICEYVVGLFFNLIIVDNGNSEMEVNIIIMYE